MQTALIADDSSFMRTLIRRALEKAGYFIAGEAENGIVCVEKYEEFQPDLVTLDVTMAKMDGMQALSALMIIDPAATVIMISALGQENIIHEAIIAGAKAFIVKPFQEDQLISTLRKLTPNE